MTDILSWWNAILEAAAVIAIVVIAIGLMIGVIDARRAVGRIGAVLGTIVLLLVLPSILLGLWRSLSLWQQLGIITLLGLVVVAIFHRGTHLQNKRGGKY